MSEGNHYGFTLPDELVLLRDQIRRFMREQVKPIEDALPHDATGCAAADRARLRAQAEAMGLTRLTVPEEHGGNPVSALARVVIAEESAKCRLGAYAPALGAFGGGPPNIIWGGTQAQIDQYGIPCVEGNMRAFVAITEPTGGSDPRNNIQTRAVRQGDQWILNGRKMWITAAKGADYGVIFARTKDGTASAPPEITAFIVEPTFPGVSFNEIRVIRALSPYEIVLENCQVPAENVLGTVGRGFGVAQNWLVDARIPYGRWLHRHRTGSAGHGVRLGEAAPGARRRAGGQASYSVDDRGLRSGAEGGANAGVRCRQQGGRRPVGQGGCVDLQAVRH